MTFWEVVQAVIVARVIWCTVTFVVTSVVAVLAVFGERL